MDDLDDASELLTPPDNCAINRDHPAMIDPDHWCVGPIIRTRDSSILEESNADALLKTIEDLDGWETHRFSHWAVGWVDHLSFRVLDDDGEPTPVYAAVKAFYKRLDDYPVADEADFSTREYEEALRAINDEGGRWLKDGEDPGWEEMVYGWLWDHEQLELENLSPSRESIARAMVALGIYCSE